LTHYGNGSTTLMRGKSATCRRRLFFSFGSSTRHGQRPFRINGPRIGKSETCRASEWQSHCSGLIKGRQRHARSQVCRYRWNGSCYFGARQPPG